MNEITLKDMLDVIEQVKLRYNINCWIDIDEYSIKIRLVEYDFNYGIDLKDNVPVKEIFMNFPNHLSKYIDSGKLIRRFNIK